MRDFTVDGVGNRPCDLDDLTVDLFLLVLRCPVDERACEDREGRDVRTARRAKTAPRGYSARRWHGLTIVS
jgi:hypothetical protein